MRKHRKIQLAKAWSIKLGYLCWISDIDEDGGYAIADEKNFFGNIHLLYGRKVKHIKKALNHPR
jgi:hypothetical protein